MPEIRATEQKAGESGRFFRPVKTRADSQLWTFMFASSYKEPMKGAPKRFLHNDTLGDVRACLVVANTDANLFHDFHSIPKNYHSSSILS